jgi:large subunit ribosomal protein L28
MDSKAYTHIVKRKLKKPEVLKIGDPKTKLPRRSEIPEIPPYPYGQALIFKRSDRGLYGGKIIQFGHRIVGDFKKHNKRTFKPNIQRARLYSETLKKTFRLRVATKVLRTISREGGLDNYLIKDTPQRVKQLGLKGWELRYRVLRTMEEHSRTAPKTVGFVTTKKGKQLPIYARYSHNGDVLNIKTSRTKLLRMLFFHMKETQNPVASSLARFLKNYRSKTTKGLLDTLRDGGVDVTALAYKAPKV